MVTVTSMWALQIVPEKGEDPEHDLHEKAFTRLATRCCPQHVPAYARAQTCLLKCLAEGVRAGDRNCRLRGLHAWHLQQGNASAGGTASSALMACRGVVQLFNAISKAQERKRSSAQPHQRSKVRGFYHS